VFPAVGDAVGDAVGGIVGGGVGSLGLGHVDPNDFVSVDEN